MEEDTGEQNLAGKNLDSDLDPDLQKKHQSMLERLSVRHQTRLDNTLTRRSDSSNSSESTSTFLSRFSETKQSIEAQLAESREIASSDPVRLKPHLDGISSSISDLEKLVAENSYFLPSYEVRSSLRTVSDLRQNLENCTAELVPRKKFSFKNKATTKKELPKEQGAEKSGPATVQASYNVEIRDSPGFRSKTNESLEKRFRGTEGGEFTLTDLDSCEVRLSGSFNALFINRVRNCKIYSGPVTGSVLIEDVEGCTFVLASHQIRIHLAKRSDFYLRVRSRPIIEDSNGVRFAPYCLEYKGIEDELEAAGLSLETGNWANVDDFKWLRAVHSPNWSLVPENERVEKVCVANSETGSIDS